MGDKPIVKNRSRSEGPKAATTTPRQSDSCYRWLLDNIPLGIVVIDRRGRIENLNRKLLEILDTSPDRLPTGGMPTDLPPLVDTDIAALLQNCRQTGEREEGESSYRTESGNEIFLKIDVIPRNWKTDAFSGAMAIVEDISVMKRIEAQIHQSHNLEAMGMLAGGIAHDFNNILWLIAGNAELAAAGLPVGSPVRYNLEQVEKACRRAQELVTQILRFSRRTGSGKKPLKISTVVRESLKLLRASIPANIEIRHHISTDADMVMADLPRLNQMLIHLYTNAAHAMENTGGILEVSIVDVNLGEEEIAEHPDLLPGGHIIITVLDTGPGIGADVLNRIFDPFFTTKPPTEHTGMGLSIVNAIVREHGGTVTVQSEMGKGTIVHVILPALPLPSADTGPDGNDRFSGDGAEILFVDDEEPILRMASQMLRKMGYRVNATSRPQNAIDQFAAEPNRYGMVITDQTMPELNGTELARRILEIRPDIPIILCTGFAEQITEESIQAIGIRALLSKPLTMNLLSRTIAKHLKGS